MGRPRTRKQGGQANKSKDTVNEHGDSDEAGAANVDQQPPVDLDRERLECMKRNQQRLQALGLLHMVQTLRQVADDEVAKKHASKKRPLPGKENAAGEERVVRRSLRTKGEEPELPALLEPMFRKLSDERPYGSPGTMVRAAKPRAPPSSGGGDAAKFDAHNLHRLRTMSDEAMTKRIHKISNTLKLKSLVQLLREFGRDELAEEAQAALDERLACV